MDDYPVEGYNTWSGSVHRWMTIQWKVTIHGQGKYIDGWLSSGRLQYMVRVSTQMDDCPVEGYNTWSGLVHRWMTTQWKVTIHYNTWSGLVHRWMTTQWKVTIHGQGQYIDGWLSSGRLQYMVRVSTQMDDYPVEGYNTWSGLVHRWMTIQWKVTIHGQGQYIVRWTIQWKVTIHGQG